MAAEILRNMDPSVNPCQDFYSFACGGFVKNTVFPDDQVSADKITQQLRPLIEKPIREEEAEPFKLVKRLYQSCLNKSISFKISDIDLDI
jgi:predicted metalloendopeptidase